MMAPLTRLSKPRLSSNWHKSSRQMAASASPLRSRRSVFSAPMTTFYTLSAYSVRESQLARPPHLCKQTTCVGGAGDLLLLGQRRREQQRSVHLHHRSGLRCHPEVE